MLVWLSILSFHNSTQTPCAQSNLSWPLCPLLLYSVRGEVVCVRVFNVSSERSNNRGQRLTGGGKNWAFPCTGELEVLPTQTHSSRQLKEYILLQEKVPCIPFQPVPTGPQPASRGQRFLISVTSLLCFPRPSDAPLEKNHGRFRAWLDFSPSA